MNSAKSVVFKAGFFSRLSAQDKIDFARHLSITIKASLPIFECLKIIRKQARTKLFAKILDQVLMDVNNGMFLADALARYEHMFGEFFINVVRIGEASGTLGPNLLYLSGELQKSQSLRSKIRSAMIYPIILLVATVGIISFLMIVIFPKIIPVFASLRVTLPLSTKILIKVSDFVSGNALFVGIGAVALIVLIKALFMVKGIRALFDKFLFLIPVVSRLNINYNIANLTRIMGILLKSGIGIVDAVVITSKTFRSAVYRDALAAAADKIRTGEQFATYLMTRKKVFPPLAVSMIEIGENTGSLEENLFYLAEYYTEELDTSLKNLTVLMEPLLLLFMGLLVGFVAISIITPIYSITQGITNG